MIITYKDKEYYIDDTILKQPPPPKVYVKEIPSLRINYGDKGTLQGITGSIYYLSVPHFLEEFVNHDGNNVGICSFPPFPKTEQTFEFLEAYIKSHDINDNTKFLFDNMYEGHVIGPLVGIHKIIDKLELNHKNVYFFTCGMQAQFLYDCYCTENNITNKVNIRVVNVWERHISRHSDNTILEPKFEINNKSKLFLCFNRIARKQRVALLALLYEKDLVKNSFYSFFPSLYGNAPIHSSIDELESFISKDLLLRIKGTLKQHFHELPLLLNTTTVNDNVNYVKSDDDYYYRNSYFSVVTETFFFQSLPQNVTVVDENSVFFSEKIFKPIICKHPFILLGRPYSLDYLKRIGYKTFSPYIDESYDLIEDDESRLIKVCEEIEKLSKFTNEEWIEWEKNVQPIIEFNYRVIVNKGIKDHSFKEY